MLSTKIQAFLVAAGVLATLAACSGPQARSQRSFNEIQQLVEDKSAAQVLRLLGEPDSRQTVFDADERWIWWNYTFLDGSDYPPEMRGRVVHLEIVFKNPGPPPAGGSTAPGPTASPRPYAEWRVDDALGVSFQLPATGS